MSKLLSPQNVLALREDGGGPFEQQQRLPSTLPKKNRSEVRQQIATAWQKHRRQSKIKQPLMQQALHQTGGASVVDDKSVGGERRQDNRASDSSRLSKRPSQNHGNSFATTDILNARRHSAPVKIDATLLSSRQSAGRRSTWSLAKQTPKPANRRSSSSSKPLLRQRHERGFPSLLAIHQAHELAKQVDMIQSSPFDDDDDDDDDNDDHDDDREESNNSRYFAQDKNISSGSKEDLLLSILPAGYDLEKAVFEMAKSRSRAFWLLDLAAVVYRLVAWNRFYSRSTLTAQQSTTSQPEVHFMFRAESNSDPILMRLLSRFDHQVRLVTSSAWDYGQCSEALSTLSASAWTNLVMDDSTHTGKSDGYIRKALLGSISDNNDGSTRVLSCITVDGPEEIHRIWDTLERIRARRRRQNQIQETKEEPIPDVCLRFASDAQNLAQRFQETEAALHQRSSKSRISALSVDVSWVVEESSRLDSFFEFLASGSASGPLRLEVTGRVTLEDEESMAFFPRLMQNPLVASTFNEICVDMTESLLTSAGSLCTRVIGVRHGAANESGIQRQHYYIDDGCYGSLCQQEEQCNAENSPAEKNSRFPVPLKTRSYDADGPSDSYVSTIWGPTCDGLDRVFENIKLPLLHRDDWLVFPNQCSVGGGQGTAFNGFKPPDTAYCVLGFFGR